VRLDPASIPPLIAAIRRELGDDAEVWLFGSRVDDNARGGDIDLYVETDREAGLVASRARLAADLATVFGERKVDLLVRPRSRAPQPIHRIARRDGVRLSAAASGPASGRGSG
jgi:predicted nucleotidyltransferase